MKDKHRIMNWRLASRLSVVTLALLVVLVVAVLSLRNATGAPVSGLNSTPTTSSGTQGTDLGGKPAPAFSLHDQFDNVVTLAQLAGKPVVLTFMYTHCPDVCPVMAERLHSVMVGLGADAQRVAVVAISVDPRGDTVASALAFSKAHRMVNYWHFLVGTQNELSPVWTNYAIDAQPAASTVSMHTAILYVLDKQGRERWLLDQDFTTAQLTTDLQALLKE
jgi:protein SCO1